MNSTFIHNVKGLTLNAWKLTSGGYAVSITLTQATPGGNETNHEINLFPHDERASDLLLALERGATRELEAEAIRNEPGGEPEDEQLRAETEEWEAEEAAYAKEAELPFARSLDPELGDLDEIPF